MFLIFSFTSFRFLTPCPPVDEIDLQVNDVARQAGANPITLPSDNINTTIADGEISPTSVYDLSIYPSWTDVKDAPSWYARGSDVDALLDVADALDWLADTGDLNEIYDAPPKLESVPSLPDMDDDDSSECEDPSVNVSTSAINLPRVDSNMEAIMVPALPSLFQNGSTDNLYSGPSSDDLKALPSSVNMLDSHLKVFDTPMEEDAFVLTILEDNNDTSDCLPLLV